MPFQTRTIMTARKEFVKLASQEGTNKRMLCARFNISVPTGNKWFERYLQEGEEGLYDRSRRPIHSPNRTSPAIENMIVDVRKEHPAWGAYKIHQRLIDLGQEGLPCVTTVNNILKRHGMIKESESAKRKKWKRFEMDNPNESWQMDFKGYFYIGKIQCHPLTVIDDYSRYLIGVRACTNEKRITVHEELTEIFKKYGLPETIATDNGSPWAATGVRDEYTKLGVWLIRLGIRLRRIPPYHPQSNGKIERLHRSLKAEVIQGRIFKNIEECQHEFDKWQYVYNYERPHQAIDMKVPGKRYQLSKREFPTELFTPEYGPDDEVRKVQKGGIIDFKGKSYKVGKGFEKMYVAVRPTRVDGIYDVVCIRQKIKTINLRDNGTP